MSEELVESRQRSGTISPPGRPDFSQPALQELVAQCKKLRLDIQAWINESSETNSHALVSEVGRIRSTLQLIGRPGANLLCNEVTGLVHCMQQGTVQDRDEAVRVLINSGEIISDYVEYLERGAFDNALSLLPAVNNCRACCDKELVTAAWIMSAGIDFSAEQGLPAPTVLEFAAFQDQLHKTRLPLIKQLLNWYRSDSEMSTTLADISTVMLSLANSTNATTSLSVFRVLFQSASIVSRALSEHRLENSPAIKKLFAQLERFLKTLDQLESNDVRSLADLLPTPLVQNFLYYVAIAEDEGKLAQSLMDRFQLYRFIQSHRKEPAEVVTPLNDRLVKTIHASIEVEVEQLSQWLGDTELNADAEELANIIDRFTQLEVVVFFLNAPQAQSALTVINHRLTAFLKTPAVFTPIARLALAELVVRFERALADDLQKRHTSQPTAMVMEGNLSSGSEVSSSTAELSESVSILSAEDALQQMLDEAQRRLLQVEVELGDYFEGRLAQSERQLLVDQELERIAGALMIVPMPEVQSLLQGFVDELVQNSAQWSGHQQEQAARALISLNFYLDCVLKPQPVASELLLEAEQALELLRDPRVASELLDDTQALKSKAKAQIPASLLQSSHSVFRRGSHDGSITGTPGTAFSSDTNKSAVTSETASPVDQALELLSIIAAGVMDLGVKEDVISAQEVRNAFMGFESLAADSLHSNDLTRYAKANVSLLDALIALLPTDYRLSEDTQACLDESVAAMPELINQLQGSTDSVDGLDALIARVEQETVYLAETLRTTAIAHNVGADTGDVASLIYGAAVAADSTLDIDGNYPEYTQSLTAEVPADEFTEMDLDAPLTVDTGLLDVYFRECATHLETLERAVDNALQSNGQQLPSEELLRALHTLSGCSQTVDAGDIVSVVQPLQRFAVQRQHDATPFTGPQSTLFKDAIVLLKKRLRAMQHPDELVQIDHSVEQRIAQLLEDKTSELSQRRDLELDNVFKDEAIDLFSQLRQCQILFEDKNSVDKAKSMALSVLHTLKGSARMVGRGLLADQAHELESSLQSSLDAVSCRRVLDDGLQTMEALLSDSMNSAVDSTAAAAQQNPGRPNASESSAKPVEPSGEVPAFESTNREHGKSTTAFAAPVSKVSADTFERLLNASTEVSVLQTQLGEKVAALRSLSLDFENVNRRLEKLAHAQSLLSGPDADEILADLSLTQRQLAEHLRDSFLHQKTSSRLAKSLQQELIRTQLIQFKEGESRLNQVLNDTAANTNKLAVLELQGGEITVDKTLFQKLLAPLEHLVRNSVVHGLETEQTRIASAKKSVGRVTVRCDIDGNDLVICVSDDGGGVDESLLEKISAPGSAVDLELTHLLSQEGFSTLESANQLAGRGLGLSSVKHTMQTLDGQLHIASEPGNGTAVTLRVPQRLVVHQVIQVRVGDNHFAIPVNFVHGVLDDCPSSQDRMVQHHDSSYRVESLVSILSNEASENGSSTMSAAVLVEVNGAALALLVDEVLGYQEVIAQPLGVQLRSLQCYFGGSVLANGTHLLILDLQKALQRPIALKSTTPLKSIQTQILLADDSITMRHAATQMLQKQGFHVRIAKDGAEAWDELQTELPAALIIDIDMPKLNGFDVLDRMVNAGLSGSLPIIMISTQDTDDVYLRAQQLGVSRFINKPYLEEELLAALRFVGLVS